MCYHVAAGNGKALPVSAVLIPSSNNGGTLQWVLRNRIDEACVPCLRERTFTPQNVSQHQLEVCSCTHAMECGGGFVTTSIHSSQKTAGVTPLDSPEPTTTISTPSPVISAPTVLISVPIDDTHLPLVTLRDTCCRCFNGFRADNFL